jgi:hypothetical protein
MGQRANYVIIRANTAAAFYDHWGALGCLYSFAEGPDKAANAASASSRTDELQDWAFAEGGYLLDFDEKRAIVFGYPGGADIGDLAELVDLGQLGDTAQQSLASAAAIDDAFDRGPLDYLRLVSAAWAGWSLEWDDRGVDAFAAHLERRLIRSIKVQPTSDRSDLQHLTLQA